jgi:hypothetical protein
MRARDASPLLKVTPKDLETGVPRDATVQVTAPRRVDHLSTQGVSVRTEDREVDGALYISSCGRVLFWRPLEALPPDARFQVTICGVRDERGAPFDDHSSTFVTGAFSYLDLQLLAE